MNRVSEKDRFSGCLVGQCLGDAIGFCMEGHPPEICAPYVEELRSRDPKDRLMPHGGFPIGQYTDDSQLARELMSSYADCHQFNPADYAERIRAIFAEERIVGRGLATEAAARRLIAGVHWEEAGAGTSHAGNGTAMRAGPVGLLYRNDPELLIRVAHDQGRITHKDGRCSAGSVAIAGAVALAMQDGEISRDTFLGQLSEWMKDFDAPFAERVLELTEWLDLAPEDAAPIASRSGLADYVDGWRWISPFVVPSVLWSLYSFLHTPKDYWETIFTAIVAGGDVDSTAAMAGAISGAHLGLERLPLEPAKSLNDRGTWGLAELVSLAHRCYAIAKNEF